MFEAPANIWEFVSREPFIARHTWEEFGHLSTFKEPPFLCESSSKTSEWLQNLSPNFDSMAFQRGPTKVADARVFVEFKDFIKDAQHLLGK